MPGSGVFFLAVAVFLLASGSSGLNQCQERHFDAKMERTRNRPLPSGKMELMQAVLIAVALITAGTIILLLLYGVTAALLGLFNVIWYNGLYTYLKRVTPYAVVPGSLTGAVPVLIGWTAAGGYLLDAAVIFIAFFIFIWQVPHFWLLMLKHGNEYRNAGFPTINSKLSPAIFNRIIFSWIIATSASSLMVPLFLNTVSAGFVLVMVAINIVFVLTFSLLSFGKTSEISLRRSFLSLNIYMFIFMAMLLMVHLLYR